MARGKSAFKAAVCHPMTTRSRSKADDEAREGWDRVYSNMDANTRKLWSRDGTLFNADLAMKWEAEGETRALDNASESICNVQDPLVPCPGLQGVFLPPLKLKVEGDCHTTSSARVQDGAVKVEGDCHSPGYTSDEDAMEDYTSSPVQGGLDFEIDLPPYYPQDWAFFRMGDDEPTLCYQLGETKLNIYNRAYSSIDGAGGYHRVTKAGIGYMNIAIHSQDARRLLNHILSFPPPSSMVDEIWKHMEIFIRQHKGPCSLVCKFLVGIAVFAYCCHTQSRGKVWPDAPDTSPPSSMFRFLALNSTTGGGTKRWLGEGRGLCD